MGPAAFGDAAQFALIQKLSVVLQWRMGWFSVGGVSFPLLFNKFAIHLCLCVRSEIPVSGAALDRHEDIHIPVDIRVQYVRRDDREHFVSCNCRVLRHWQSCEHLRACVPVGHQRDRHRRADRPHYVAFDNADANYISVRHRLVTHKRVDNAGLHSSRLYCVQASNVLVHASYSSSTELNDFALLYFASPFTFTSNVGSLPLPPQGTAFADGLTCTVSGWGTTSYGNSGVAVRCSQLRALELWLFSLCFCIYAFSYLWVIER